MRAARRDLPALTRLWQACFGDTEAEVRAFWQALFDCTPVYLRRAPDGSPAAMLCALPAELVGDDGDAVPAAYLYAVCTAPALRGRGRRLRRGRRRLPQRQASVGQRCAS